MADRFGYGEIGLDIHPCRGCEDYDEPDGCKSNGGCGKPITNADRIRAMTDEELADWLGVYCNGQTAQEVGKPCASGVGSCEECWLDWLKQEVNK